MFIVFITRHYNQKKRVSGVISYLKILDQMLKKNGVQTVILYVKNKTYENYAYEKNAYLTSQNPLIIAKILKKLKPTHIIFISSTSDPTFLYWWWLSLAFANQKQNCYLYQTTNFKKSPNKIQLCLLKRLLQGVFVGNSNLYKIFKILPKKKLMKPAVTIDYAFRKAKHYTQNKFTVLFMGHYTKIKGVDIVLTLSQKSSMKELEFYIAGGNSRNDNFYYKKALKAARLMPNLSVLGFLENPQSIISKCDVLLIPYRSGSTILAVSQTALEAMALGKPVITTSNTATNDLVKDGFNGYICDSISSMEKKIIDLKNNPTLYNKLARNALATIKNEYNIEERTKQLLESLNAGL